MLQEVFVAIANFWHSIFGWLMDPALDIWTGLLKVRGLGEILSFFETYFGRGPTL